MNLDYFRRLIYFTLCFVKICKFLELKGNGKEVIENFHKQKVCTMCRLQAALFE